MKQKMIIGALAFASIFAFAQKNDDSSSETDRRFWGREITGVVSCVQNGWFPDGSPKYNKVYEVTRYVLWVGISTSSSEPIESSNCDMP